MSSSAAHPTLLLCLDPLRDYRDHRGQGHGQPGMPLKEMNQSEQGDTSSGIRHLEVFWKQEPAEEASTYEICVASRSTILWAGCCSGESLATCL